MTQQLVGRAHCSSGSGQVPGAALGRAGGRESLVGVSSYPPAGIFTSKAFAMCACFSVACRAPSAAGRRHSGTGCAGVLPSADASSIASPSLAWRTSKDVPRRMGPRGARGTRGCSPAAEPGERSATPKVPRDARVRALHHADGAGAWKRDVVPPVSLEPHVCGRRTSIRFARYAQGC